jgi:hypothetical protein
MELGTKLKIAFVTHAVGLQIKNIFEIVCWEMQSILPTSTPCSCWTVHASLPRAGALTTQSVQGLATDGAVGCDPHQSVLKYLHWIFVGNQPCQDGLSSGRFRNCQSPSSHPDQLTMGIVTVSEKLKIHSILARQISLNDSLH